MANPRASTAVLNHKGKAAGLASEDLEAVLYLRRSGCEIWYNPDQVVFHHIPDGRLQVDYLTLLFRCIGFSRLYVRLMGQPSWKRPFIIPIYVANDLRRLVLHLLKHRQSGDSRGNVLTQCDRTYLSASLLSPIKLAQKVVQDQTQAVQDRWHFPHRKAWLSALAIALEADQFKLYGQALRPLQSDPSANEAVSPAVSPSTSGHSAAPTEVLLRMAPELMPEAMPLPSPREFMALAVRYGLTVRIDRWVIGQVLQHLASFPRSVHNEAVPQYSINLSAASLVDDSLAAFVERQLKSRSLPAAVLTFELDEMLLLQQYERLLPGLQALQSLGCSLTLDNFSQQLSSQQMVKLPLGYLKFTPASLRKGDRQPGLKQLWVEARGNGSAINHPQSQRLQTVAKGIETPMALAQVTRIGLDYAQGYGVARPRPLET